MLDFFTLDGAASLTVQDVLLTNMCRMLYAPDSSRMPAALFAQSISLFSITRSWGYVEGGRAQGSGPGVITCLAPPVGRGPWGGGRAQGC